MTNKPPAQAGFSRVRLTMFVSALALLACLSSMSGVASANNWFGATGNFGCGPSVPMANMTDNVTFRYHRYLLTPKMEAATGWILTNAVNITDLNTLGENPSTLNTDAIYYDEDYLDFCGFEWHPAANGLVGLADCKALAGQRCERYGVRYDTSRTEEAAVTVARARKLACHETGHAIGLAHSFAGDNTCMADILNNIVFTTYSGDHEVPDHINANF